MEQEKDDKKEAINIPNLNSYELVVPICEKLDDLFICGEAIKIWRPFHSYTQLRQLRKKRQELAKNYYLVLQEVYSRLTKPTSGPGFTMAWAQTWSTAMGLAAVTKLQNSWSQFDSVIDRKSTYAIAWVSFYIAIFSMIVTTVFGCLSLL